MQPQFALSFWTRIILVGLACSLAILISSPKGRSQTLVDEINVTILEVNRSRESSAWNSRKLGTLRPSQVQNRQLYDLQYGQSREYAVINLYEGLMALMPPSQVNTAILHFNNGMIIPMPLNSSQGPAVWLAWKFRDHPNAGWSRNFPEIAKPSIQWRDPRPIRFIGNKVIVSDSVYFPRQSWEIKDSFSPFKHADSLVRIELVEYQDWNAQFRISEQATALFGQSVFANRCQFCHAISGKGATFGWDLIDPLPTHERRTAQSLLFHIKYPKNHKLERGLMMPEQASISPDEANALWIWLREAARQTKQNR